MDDMNRVRRAEALRRTKMAVFLTIVIFTLNKSLGRTWERGRLACTVKK